MATETTRMRFPWVLTLFVVPAMALLVWLGVWQMQRLEWKAGLIASAEAAASEAPLSIAEALARPDPEFRKARIVCPGLNTAPYVELQTIKDGQAGVRLISACRSPDFATPFLVDRGFVADTVLARPPVSTSTQQVQIIAQLRQTPEPGPMALPADQGRFFARDNAGISQALGAANAGPYTLFALTSSNPDWQTLQPSAPPAAFSNNHLGYAITWFGLALVLLGFYVAMIRRRKQKAPQAAALRERGDREREQS